MVASRDRGAVQGDDRPLGRNVVATTRLLRRHSPMLRWARGIVDRAAATIRWTRADSAAGQSFWVMECQTTVSTSLRAGGQADGAASPRLMPGQPQPGARGSP